MTSPMSVGTWILSVFGPAAGVAAIAGRPRCCPIVLGLGHRLLPPAGTPPVWSPPSPRRRWPRTPGVLLADTAVPSWHEAYPELPAIFAGSAQPAAQVSGWWPRPAPRPVRRGASRSRARRWSCGVRTGWRTGSGCSASPTRGAHPASCCARAARARPPPVGRCAGRPAQPGTVRAVRRRADRRVGVHPVRHHFHGGVASAAIRGTVVPQRERALPGRPPVRCG
ncbi:hypothetical protein V2I01_37280 [Micromonospora sp. BRA006-A]|nr:hypothetical protein [Micromonospora sp. BRA006-A]